jgi:hypothetical protein
MAKAYFSVYLKPVYTMLAFTRKCTFIVCFCILYFITPAISFAQDTDRQAELSKEIVNYISSLCKDIEEKGRLVNTLTEDDFTKLPVGIAREVGGTTLVIAIDSAVWTPKGWFFNAYTSITLPGTTKPVAFAARNIAFNKTGFAASTQIRLMLAAPQRFDVSTNMDINLPADGHNYVEFNCDGFKAINLKGEFIFYRGFLVPDEDAGLNEVTATFEINTGDLNNILASVSITPFKINGLDELSFEVRNATVDYSDIVNPSGFSFPQDYQQAYGDDIKLWRGFFLQDVIIRLTGITDDSDRVPTIGAHNLIIDDMGVSGLFTADNLAALKDASASGWPLTVEHLHVQLMFNRVKGGGLGGNITLPFLGDDPVAFDASVEQSGKYINYRFSVATPEEKKFNTPFNAKVHIKKGSVISIEKINKKLTPSAVLHGSMTFEQSMLSVKDIKFQNLTLTTRKPFITGGEFSIITTKQDKSVGFPIHIDSITLKIYQGLFGIGFGVTLNFMNSEDKSFSASTHIQALVKLEEKEETYTDAEGTVATRTHHKWKFDKIKVNTVELNCETQAFKLKGSLSIYDDDPVYGDGFSGNLNFSIDPVLKKGVKVNAYFGSKDSYRYWHLDAYVPIGSIPIYPPVLYMTGIMGGASYHMVRKQNFSMDFSKLNVPSAAPTGDEALVYIPDEKTGLAFMAGITLSVVREELVNGDIKLEIAFNKNGGLRYVQFDGSAFILSALADRERSTGGSVPKAPIYVNMSMIYDNENDMFHANSRTYINLFGVLTGVGPGGLVGEAVMHFDKKDWYIYVGRPSQMFGIQILSLASVQTYFMTGTRIEDLPLPPMEVREIFEGIDLRLMRDELSTKGGKGLAAGFHFRVAFDSKDKVRPFYIQVAVGAGSDMMLRDYGNAQCEGREGKVGINGWYASGQAYVFLQGRVGIRVKKRSFEILSLGAAALLQATLPNPAWMRGMIGGHYSVLGGLVKGKFNLKMVIGEQCEIINYGEELDDIKIIADLKPDESTGETSVFSAPQVSFNTPINTQFSMVDARDNLNDYRIQLKEFLVSKDGNTINATLEWNENKDVAVLHTSEILPPQSTLKVLAKVYWEKKSDNGLWEAMKEETGGPVYYETKEATFKTGEAPPFIPEENVAYSYPVKNQYNLYLNESNQGYVKLTSGQDYLFKTQTEDGVTWSFIARFEDKKKGSVTEVPLSYEATKANAAFEIPASLSRQAVYTLTFIKRPVIKGGVDTNVKRSEVTKTDGDGNETSVASNTLEGTITQDVEKEIYSTAFRTSQFGKFEEKIALLEGGNDLHDIAVGMTAIIFKRSTLKETFDDIELRGKDEKTPLIQITATADNPWMKDHIAPIIYDSYPVNEDMKLEWRDPAELGVKPLKGVVLVNEGEEKYKLSDANVTAGFAPAKSGTVYLGYFVSYYAIHDYSELLNKAGAVIANNANPPAGVKTILAGKYWDLIKGYSYPVEITYTLPGATQPSFKKQVTIKY